MPLIWAQDLGNSSVGASSRLESVDGTLSQLLSSCFAMVDLLPHHRLERFARLGRRAQLDTLSAPIATHLDRP
jgi:hypothetical protein